MASNPQNLRRLTPEEAREIGAKGGKASGEAKRKRKAMRECVETLLSMPMAGMKSFKDFPGIDDDDKNGQMLLLIGLYKKAAVGDVAAFRELKEMVGEDTGEEVVIVDDM